MAGGRLWTNKEIKTLKRMYPDNKNKTIAQEINRTINAIQRKATKLNLKKSEKHF